MGAIIGMRNAIRRNTLIIHKYPIDGLFNNKNDPMITSGGSTTTPKYIIATFLNKKNKLRNTKTGI